MGGFNHVRLENLPTEILWRIATLSSAESGLAAMKVCHRLHAAFNDALVFRAMLDAGDIGIDLDDVASRVGNDRRAWARLALADCKARMIVSRRSSLVLKYTSSHVDGNSIQDLDRYAPSLVTLKHTMILRPEAIAVVLNHVWDLSLHTPVHRARQFRTMKRTEQESLQNTSAGLAFCLCASSAAYPDEQYNDIRQAEKLLSVCANTVEDLVLQDNDAFGTHDNFGSIFTVALAHIALSAWTSLLKLHIDQVGDQEDPRPPKPFNIPWLQTTDPDCIPFPYQPPSAPDDSGARPTTTWDQWYKDRVEYMTDPSYLTEGEWCGYWSSDNYTHDPFSVEFASPIERMALVIPNTRRSPRYGRTALRITATYPNSHHNFVLEGSISRDGLFDLGPPGEFWVWRGRMTPFGMFGFWGSSDWSRMAGACWLWKRSWCEATKPAPA